jgi:hypothetical protein
MIADDGGLVSERHEPPNVWRVVSRGHDVSRRRGAGEHARGRQRSFRWQLLRVSPTAPEEYERGDTAHDARRDTRGSRCACADGSNDRLQPPSSAPDTARD